MGLTAQWANVRSILIQRLPRWPNIELTSGQCIVFAGIYNKPSRHKTLNQCWFNVGPPVYDAEPTLNQNWFNVLCLLGTSAGCYIDVVWAHGTPLTPSRNNIPRIQEIKPVLMHARTHPYVGLGGTHNGQRTRWRGARGSVRINVSCPPPHHPPPPWPSCQGAMIDASSSGGNEEKQEQVTNGKSLEGVCTISGLA